MELSDENSDDQKINEIEFYDYKTNSKVMIPEEKVVAMVIPKKTGKGHLYVFRVYEDGKLRYNRSINWTTYDAFPYKADADGNRITPPPKKPLGAYPKPAARADGKKPRGW